MPAPSNMVFGLEYSNPGRAASEETIEESCFASANEFDSRSAVSEALLLQLSASWLLSSPLRPVRFQVVEFADSFQVTQQGVGSLETIIRSLGDHF